MNKRLHVKGCVLFLFGVLIGTASLSAEDVTILSLGSKWKVNRVFFDPMISVKSAKEANLPIDEASRIAKLSKVVASGVVTEALPKDWQSLTFDDYDWSLERGEGFKMSIGSNKFSVKGPMSYYRGTDKSDPEVGLAAYRGKFLVQKKSDIKSMSLDVVFRGGLVVYLNGKEIARKFLPSGEISYKTPAEDYDLDAFFVEVEGKKEALHYYNHRGQEFSANWEKRERSSGKIEINPNDLIDGLNVLSLELHRADYPVECASKKIGYCFATIGLANIVLKADTNKDNVSLAEGRHTDFQVWNAQSWEAVTEMSYNSEFDGLKPIKISGAANGLFSGQFVIGSSNEILDLKVEAEALVGSSGAVGVENIEVRFGGFNPTKSDDEIFIRGLEAKRFDLLDDVAPQKIAVAKVKDFDDKQSRIREVGGLQDPNPGAVLPIWISIKVPKGLNAGLYKGGVKVSAKGVDPVVVPIELNISAWELPDLKNFTPPYFIYQSPESLAIFYEVEPWSDKHWALIEKSLKLMGEFGNGGIILSPMAETCMGNPEGMVLWLKQADGSYKYDFSRYDKYIELAMKYHIPERLTVVGLNVWGYEVRDHKGVLHKDGKVTVVSPDGTKTFEILPEYGTAECEAFWKPVLLEMKSRLKKYNFDDKIMFGAGGDVMPTPKHAKMLNDILPGTPWYRESHFPSNRVRLDLDDKSKVVPVGCTSMVWGGSIPMPHEKRLYGWKFDPSYVQLNFNRFGTGCLVLKGFPSPWEFRMWMESTITCGRNGNGRVGGDFFDLNVNLSKEWGRKVKSENKGGSGGTLYGSYPASAVGQIGLGNNCTDLFGPGRDGPVTTIRLENARAGNQEAEARIFIERAIVDGAIAGDLLERCQAFLDRRTLSLKMWEMNRGVIELGRVNWRIMNQKLFDLAGEVAVAVKK